MYNIIEMTETIQKAVSVVENKVKDEFIDAFKEIYKKNMVPSHFDQFNQRISIVKLKDPADLKRMFAGIGFYIIFTNLQLENNECVLYLKEKVRAIYRGECRTVKKRIQSHLFNTEYKKDYLNRKNAYLAKPENAGKVFPEVFWPACLKLGDGSNGIDIDKNYKGEWFVLIHHMKDSSRAVRIQAELAFDSVFNKPIASREKRRI